ncbi:VOC family protein [Brachybacterium halotolerans subsp. kimchii]|uniref:VOC family protein n=1 Tax=Brachybacterium halotolerans TaxID=2795215 RepID=UPI001E296A62|nr:VOC family protein [Brachybacterium halotolerans]UEJ81163.1 VOC family protein [Brachybacterium halotolerans subsp. kimchii]
MASTPPPDAAPAAIAPLASVSIDCQDPRALAPFYCSLLGLAEAFATPDGSVVSLAGAGPMITLMRADDYVAPQWPDGPQHQQMHLDLAADDLDAASRAVLAIGGVEAPTQPDPARWRVMLDPVGHPFCLSAVRPD